MKYQGGATVDSSGSAKVTKEEEATLDYEQHSRSLWPSLEKGRKKSNPASRYKAINCAIR